MHTEYVNGIRIERIDGGFVEFIENGVIEKVVCMYDGTCTVFFYGKSPKAFNVGCSSYNSQYGIPVSEDGRKLFVGSWEKGLFVYEISSGEILWKLKGSKVTSIIVQRTYVIAKKYGSSIVKLDIDNGAVLAEIKSGTIERQFYLGNHNILVDSIKGRLCVLNFENMSIVKDYGSKFNSKIINPTNSLSVLIQDATLQGNALTLHGVEQEQSSNTLKLSSQKHFSRVIDSAFNDGSTPKVVEMV